MTDHWKDAVARLASAITSCDGSVALRYVNRIVDAARAKDAEAHASELAAKDAEIAALKAEIARLRAQVQQWRDHIDRSAEIENVADLYRRDPLAMADAIVRLREDVGALRAEKD